MIGIFSGIDSDWMHELKTNERSVRMSLGLIWIKLTDSGRLRTCFGLIRIRSNTDFEMIRISLELIPIRNSHQEGIQLQKYN